MTVVVADTSPLNYLVLIGQIEILRELYGFVLVPPEVLAELTEPGAPVLVAAWVRGKPDWLREQTVNDDGNDPALDSLGPGERAAILLAENQSKALLLIDDASGREEALRRGIPVTGTLGVLRAASLRGLLDLPLALARLAATNFRISQSLISELLEEDSARRARSGK